MISFFIYYKIMDTKIKILLMGITGSGKSSVVNLLANEYIAKTSNSYLSTTTEVETYSITCDNLNLEITDVGTELENFITYAKTVKPEYHLVLHIMEMGRLKDPHINQVKYVRETLGKDIPILVAINKCEGESPLNAWVERNYDFIAENMSSHLIGITAIEKGEYSILEEQKQESRRALIDSIRKLSFRSYPFRCDLIYSKQIVYFMHKRTGLYLSEDKDFTGRLYASLQPFPKEFILTDQYRWDTYLSIKYDESLSIEDTNGCVMSESLLSNISYDKRDSEMMNDYQKWIITKRTNDSLLHNGSEVLIHNQKWQNSYLSVTDTIWVKGSDKQDTWIIISP